MVTLLAASSFDSGGVATAVGALLVVVALGLLGAELVGPTHGTAAAGAAVVLVAAMIVLTWQGNGQIAAGLLVALLLAFALFLALAVWEIVRLRQRRATTGAAGLMDALGTVREPLVPQGTVFVNGELWRAATADGAPVAVGEQVRVVAMRGLTLVVVPVAATETTLPPPPVPPFSVVSSSSSGGIA